ncbi:glycoside hydrolase family 31, partial [Kipferlia bialata]|eukprot:g12386.t1
MFLPTLYSLLISAHEEGTCVACSTAVHFANDPRVVHGHPAEDMFSYAEFSLGADLLSAPVMVNTTAGRHVYLPEIEGVEESVWYKLSPETGSMYTGGMQAYMEVPNTGAGLVLLKSGGAALLTDR